jgi:hypothetical protein
MDVPLAEHLQRHALADAALGPSVLDERLVGPREHVDEAGRDGQATRFDHGRGFLAGESADGHDAIAADAHVGHEGRPATAIEDGAAANENVERRRRGRLSRHHRQHRQPQEQKRAKQHACVHGAHSLWPSARLASRSSEPAGAWHTGRALGRIRPPQPRPPRRCRC